MSDSSKAIFLSYASQDAEAARRICDALRAAGVEVWFDQNELVGGDAWDQKIRRQIRECALLIPIISAATQARGEGYFRLEWRLADQRTHLMGRNKAFLLPVCVDQTPDAGADVPDSFLAVQWTRLPAGESTPAFVSRVQRLLVGDSASQPPLAMPVSSADSSPFALQRVPASPPAANSQSVAVLAFANLSNDADNEFFSDGISEELINVMVRVPGLKVTARTSAFHFKGKSTPIPDIARQLGVAYVVEGSVRKAGERVRITAQLIQAADGFHVWSDSFTRDLKDIFAVQDEIAGLIAEKLSLKLGAAARPAREVNPAAYRLFLEGRTIINNEVPREYPKGLQCLQDSLKLDSEAALTHAWLALGYCLSAGAGMVSIEEGGRRGREAAQLAITLDPTLAVAHMALAFYQMFLGWNWKEAAALLRKASELAPGDVDIMGIQVLFMVIIGKGEQSIPLARKAVELDPMSYFSSSALLRALFYSRHYEEMDKQAERMMTLNSAGLRSRLFKALGLLLQNRPEEAAQTAEVITVRWAQLTALACIRFAQGRSAEAEECLEALKVHGHEHSQYQLAQVYAYRGERDLAFEWLEHSYEKRDTGTALVKSDPLMQSLRADPRYSAFVRKMGLADDQLA